MAISVRNLLVASNRISNPKQLKQSKNMTSGVALNRAQ